jgi:cellulose synthase/poly-beta-1,6-N-acetylglucosamine synthase-like glycosyltransferase
LNKSRDISTPNFDTTTDPQVEINSFIIDSNLNSARKKESKLEYLPLVLLKNSWNQRMNTNSHLNESALRVFHGNPEAKIRSAENFRHLPANSIIKRQSAEEMKLMLWVTMYNEPYKQFLETMAGIFRGYYELWGEDASYEGKVSVVVVCDGFKAFDSIEKDKEYPEKPTFADKLTKVGLYNKKLAKNFRWRELTYESQLNHQNKTDDAFDKDHKIEPKEDIKTEDRKKDFEMEIEKLKKESEEKERNTPKYNIKYSNLNFMNKNSESDCSRNIEFETNNLAHCFSRNTTFDELLEGLTEKEKEDFIIDNYFIQNFMKGDSTTGKFKNQKYDSLPLDIHFVIKHKNRAKIESHLWFFKGFCNQIKPEFWFIIDAGTIALWNSISKLIFYMEVFKNVGGAWGEIEVMLPHKTDTGESVSFFQSVILRSQYVEYKISHYLDKAAESIFGFVSVLPGAFSAFRWEAIKGEPLRKFLLGHTLTDSNTDYIPPCQVANKYLAEDRIMWLEIIAKKKLKDNNQGYILRYVPGIKALTDAPMNLTQLIKQRRRWFNGSMFATFYVLRKMFRVCQSGNSCLRKFFFMFLYLYMAINTIVGYFIVGLFYASFSIFVRSIFTSDDCLSVSHAANILENLYLIFLFFCLILSVWVKVEWAETHFRVWCMFMGAFTILIAVSMVYFYFESNIASISVYFLIVLTASYLSPLILNFRSLRLTDFIRGIVYVIFMSPTYVNINSIYAVSNIHDVSWGSREAGSGISVDSLKQERMEDEYKNYRSVFLIIWILLNNLVGFAVVFISKNGGIYYLLGIGGFLTMIVGIKILLSILHHFMALFDAKKVKKHIASKRYKKKFDVTQLKTLNTKDWCSILSFSNMLMKQIVDEPNEDPGDDDSTRKKEEDDFDYSPKLDLHGTNKEMDEPCIEDHHEERKQQKLTRVKSNQVSPDFDISATKLIKTLKEFYISLNYESSPIQIKGDTTQPTPIKSNNSDSNSEEYKVPPKNKSTNQNFIYTSNKKSSINNKLNLETTDGFQSNRPLNLKEDDEEKTIDIGPKKQIKRFYQSPRKMNDSFEGRDIVNEGNSDKKSLSKRIRINI